MKKELSVNQIMNLYGAIRGMDGEFKLDPKTRFDLSINMLRLEDIGRAYETARTATVARIMQENDKAPEVVVTLLVTTADAELRAAKREIDLEMISRSDLKLDVNPKLSPTTIFGLAPIISDL